MKFWRMGVAWTAAVLVAGMLGACSAEKEADDASADATASVEATMVYYAMPG